MPSIPILAEDSDQIVPATSRKVFVAVDDAGLRIGETHHKADLTDHEVELIRQLDEDGMPRAEIARKFETPKSTITMICTHQRRSTTVTRWKAILLHSPTTIDKKGKP